MSGLPQCSSVDPLWIWVWNSLFVAFSITAMKAIRLHISWDYKNMQTFFFFTLQDSDQKITYKAYIVIDRL